MTFGTREYDTQMLASTYFGLYRKMSQAPVLVRREVP